MTINETVAKLTKQHDRGLITSDDYISELQLAVRHMQMELVAKFTVTIVEDGEVTVNYVNVTYSRVREIVGYDFCGWDTECTETTCQSKLFMDQLKRIGQAMVVKRDADGEDAYTRVYTAYLV